MEARTPRRPAIIEPETLEYLEGEEDPALSAEAAHTTARTLVPAPAGQWTDPDPETLARLLAVISRDGVEPLAELWSRSPANTLPGTLWRLVLINEWASRDPGALRERHAAGLASPALGGLVDPEGAATLDLDKICGDLAGLLRGQFTGNFADLLESLQAELRVLAATTEAGSTWVESDDDELAHEVTRRHSALLATANELAEAAGLYREGRLD